MEILFVIVPLFIGVIFVFVLVQMARSVGEWAHNNSQPVLKVPAKVVSRRSETSGGWNNQPVSTSHYATFELETGVRMEFTIGGRDFGMLADGDRGTLTYQGTRYHAFDRRLDRDDDRFVAPPRR